MKIKYEDKPMTEFGELFCAAVFRTGNLFYMKTDSADENGTLWVDPNLLKPNENCLSDNEYKFESKEELEEKETLLYSDIRKIKDDVTVTNVAI